MLWWSCSLKHSQNALSSSVCERQSKTAMMSSNTQGTSDACTPNYLCKDEGCHEIHALTVTSAANLHDSGQHLLQTRMHAGHIEITAIFCTPNQKTAIKQTRQRRWGDNKSSTAIPNTAKVLPTSRDIRCSSVASAGSPRANS
jgi:hypothetical protein